MIVGIALLILLAVLGLFEWVAFTLVTMIFDGMYCSYMEPLIEKPAVMSVQAAISNEYQHYSGIVTNYISLDIAIVTLVGLVLYKLYKHKS